MKVAHVSEVWSRVLACPRCRYELAVTDAVSCGRCGRVGQTLGDHFLGFGVDQCETAAKINAWPEEFVRALPAWADSLAAGQEPSDEIYPETLRHHGLMGPDVSLTPLGDTVRYHLDEYRWQEGRKGLDGALELSEIGSTVRALDVGCGAGQTLRRLDADRPVELFGVDANPVPLALGLRLAQVEGIELNLVAASATALPFRQDTFDLVLTRVALNYMHQRSALAEMVRVLRPGGFLFCRVEGIWHDLSLLRTANGPKALVCRLRDLAWGSIHALTGWQPIPSSTLRGGRAFASLNRLRQIVSHLGCSVIHATQSPNGPLLAGRRTQLIVVAQKAGSGQPVRRLQATLRLQGTENTIAS